MRSVLYGEHQLGAALSIDPADALRERAQRLGISASGTKAQLVSRITAHVTQGRYSANFGKSSSGKASPAAAHAAQAAKLKVALDKAQAAYDAHMAKAPKLSEQGAYDEEGYRLLREVYRLTSELRALNEVQT
jgi:hypothetical protein